MAHGSSSPHPLHANIVRNKWVFRIKRHANGSIVNSKRASWQKGTLNNNQASIILKLSAPLWNQPPFALFSLLRSVTVGPFVNWMCPMLSYMVTSRKPFTWPSHRDSLTKVFLITFANYDGPYVAWNKLPELGFIALVPFFWHMAFRARTQMLLYFIIAVVEPFFFSLSMSKTLSSPVINLRLWQIWLPHWTLPLLSRILETHITFLALRLNLLLLGFSTLKGGTPLSFCFALKWQNQNLC